MECGKTTKIDFGKPAVPGEMVICTVYGTQLQKDKINYPYPGTGKEYASLSDADQKILNDAPMEKSPFDATRDIPKKQDVLIVLFGGKEGERFGKFDLSFRLWPPSNAPGQDFRNFLRNLGIDPTTLSGQVDIDEVITGKEFKAIVAPEDDRGYNHIDKSTIRPVSDEEEERDKEVAKKLIDFMGRRDLTVAQMTPTFIFDLYKKDDEFQAIGTANDISKAIQLLRK